MYLIIFNPTAGAGRSAKALEAVKQILKENQADYEIQTTQYWEHAVVLAKDAVGKGYDGIISVGGDGTLLEVAQGLAGTDETLGVIPAGTGNDFREAIGVPADVEGALSVILHGTRTSVDVGLMNGKDIFINVAGTGFDVDVVRNMNKVRKVFTGGLAYFLGIVMSIIGHRSIELVITMDGKNYKRTALLIAVANGKCYGGGLRISPESDASDGLFNIVIINSLPKWRILFELPKLKRGDIERISVAEQFRCSEITIKCNKQLSFNIDGEIKGQTPMTFTLKKSCLNVFSPRV